MDHLERMPDEGGVKKQYCQRPEDRRLQGRRQMHWQDDIEKERWESEDGQGSYRNTVPVGMGMECLCIGYWYL